MPEKKETPQKVQGKVLVKYKTLSAGSEGIIHPDTVIEVDEKQAKALVNGGFAEIVKN